jgi:hypothetical protein
MLQGFATRHLALEALVVLTSVDKTASSVVHQVSRALLLLDEGNRPEDEENDDDDDSMEEDTTATSTPSSLVRMLIRLAVSGQWGDDDDQIVDAGNAVDGRASFLALQALVNAMHVVDSCSSESLQAFYVACRQCTGQEWVAVLWQRVQAAPSQPHEAYLAAKALCRLQQHGGGNNDNGGHANEEDRRDSVMADADPAAAAVEQAVNCHHAALQAASRELLFHMGGC